MKTTMMTAIHDDDDDDGFVVVGGENNKNVDNNNSKSNYYSNTNDDHVVVRTKSAGCSTTVVLDVSPKKADDDDWKLKCSWGGCIIVSVIYMLCFIATATNTNTSTKSSLVVVPSSFISNNMIGGEGLTDGFCVWNFRPPHPDRNVGCTTPNSHSLSWYVDLAMAILVIVIMMGRHIYYKCYPQTMSDVYSMLLGAGGKKNNDTGRISPHSVLHKWWDIRSLMVHLAVAASIFFHGILHYWISKRGCFLPIEEDTDDDSNNNSDNDHHKLIAEICYALFTYMLCRLLFIVALPNMKHPNIYSVFTAVFTLIITKNVTPIYSLSTIFVVTHILSSIVGYIGRMQSIYVTWQLGFTFLLATIAGLVELMMCDSYELDMGGHVWYDGLLHISMIVVLITAPTIAETTTETTNTNTQQEDNDNGNENL